MPTHPGIAPRAARLFGTALRCIMHDPDYVPSAAKATAAASKRGRRAMRQPQQVKLRLRRVKPGFRNGARSIKKARMAPGAPQEASSCTDASVGPATTATGEEVGSVQPCLWHVMAAYSLPPRKRRRHRLEGADLDSFAATQYYHSVASTL